MNKKKNMRRMAGAMAVVVAAGAAGTCGYQRSAITAKAAEVDTEKLEQVAENALSTKSDDAEETGTTKEESVYVKADPSGKVKKTTVTEWLKNTGNGELSDTSDLSDIKNIKGDEEYKESGDELSWEAVGDDIYYQGTTDKELPVGVKISYKLDGKDISAEDLQGKDGKVEIHIKYSNTSKSTQDVNGASEEVFTPFTMITAMLLPADQYENVQIDNGKVISDAERQIVVGMGFPGLNDNLKLEDSDLELPEEVTITADVKNATVEPSITVATTDFLQDLDTDNIDDFSDLSNSIDELKDATNQLVDGSKEAADGASQLADGAGTLKSGTAALATGANTLVAKVPTLVQGVTALDNGASDIQGGLKTLQASVDHKKDVTNPKDQSGLVEGAADLSTGVNDYTNNVAALKAGMEATSETQPKSLMQGGSELAAGASGLASGVQTLSKTLETLVDYADKANTNAQAAATDSKTLAQTVAGLTATANVADINVTKTATFDDGKLRTALKNVGVAEENLDAAVNAVKNAGATVTVTKADLDGKVTASVNGLSDVTKLAGTVATEAGTAAGYASGADQYAQGVQKSVNVGDGTAENPGLINVSKAVADGAATVNGGLQSVNTNLGLLTSNNTKLQTGAAALSVGSQKVSAGVAELAAGSDELKAGTSTLAAGASVLASGATQLGSGATALDEGTGTLKTGADALAAGNETLAEGMAEYKAEAIDKLTSLFDGDIANVTTRLKAITDAGKDYKSFAGIKSDMSGRTKFIIETEGIDD